MIRTMAIVGTALIGTSVGLAAARRGVTVHLRDTDVAAAALGAGVLEHPEGPVDLAVPPSHVGTILAQEQRRGLARSYRDVVSVKAGPVAAGLRHAPSPASCISGHPLAGRERSGPLAARAGLLTGQHGC
ncbi:prephenate dehydrogenase/arogenate dehydrogenase family protein [Streptomyces sp. NPDC032161]|uniref:prephenate dehydrogenase/arogenate dehydrogenase family protein n=1 Tax=unclassified Streptomyces TaxID=2593676 RepID=UPI0033D18DB4